MKRDEVVVGMKVKKMNLEEKYFNKGEGTLLDLRIRKPSHAYALVQWDNYGTPEWVYLARLEKACD